MENIQFHPAACVKDGLQLLGGGYTAVKFYNCSSMGTNDVRPAYVRFRPGRSISESAKNIYHDEWSHILEPAI